jgi:hypothetical protein
MCNSKNQRYYKHSLKILLRIWLSTSALLTEITLHMIFVHNRSFLPWTRWHIQELSPTILCGSAVHCFFSNTSYTSSPHPRFRNKYISKIWGPSTTSYSLFSYCIIPSHTHLILLAETAQSVWRLASGWPAERCVFESRYRQDFSPPHVVQTGSGAHPASFPWVPRG